MTIAIDHRRHLRPGSALRAVLPLLLLVARASHPATFGFAQLQAKIDAGQVHSVEELVASLPESMRSHYVLMFASRSRQSASFEYPRAILYGDDARFIVTFNGSPNQQGFDAVEIAQFQPVSQSFELHEIRFSPDAKLPVEYSASNPAQCLTCHGSPARPLWDSAPLWPGAYGERYLQPLSSAEKQGIAQFLKEQPQNPRYRLLEGTERFAHRERFVPDAHSRYDGAVEEPPNADFSRLLQALNAQRIAAALESSPRYPAFRYALLGAAEGDCGPVANFLPAGLRDRARAATAAVAAQTLAANARAEVIRRQRLSVFAGLPAGQDDAATTTLTDVRYLAAVGLGLASGDWTLAIEQGSYDFSVPGATTHLLADRLRAQVLDDDESLAAVQADRTHSPEDAYCNELQRSSQRTIAAAQVEPASWAPAPLPLPKPEALLQHCASCHDGGTAKSLPFNNAAALAVQLRDGGFPHGDLLDEIEFRLRPQSGVNHMPLDENLDESSRSVLVSYLESLHSGK